MSIPHRPLPSATLTREERARIEVGQTAVSPAVARALCACFVAAIAIVPIVEGARLVRTGDAGTTSAWTHLTGLPAQVRTDPVASAKRGGGSGSSRPTVTCSQA
jgi:hypothetical protein